MKSPTCVHATDRTPGLQKGWKVRRLTKATNATLSRVERRPKPKSVHISQPPGLAACQLMWSVLHFKIKINSSHVLAICAKKYLHPPCKLIRDCSHIMSNAKWRGFRNKDPPLSVIICHPFSKSFCQKIVFSFPPQSSAFLPLFASEVICEQPGYTMW